MIDAIRIQLKKNLTPIVFFGVIVFVALSIWTNSERVTQQAQELYNFTNELTPFIESEVSRIANSSLIYSNTIENYEENIRDLYRLEEFISEKKGTIPDQPQSLESNAVRENTLALLDHISSNNKAIIERQELTQKLFDEVQVVSTLGVQLETGDENSLNILFLSIDTLISEIESLQGNEFLYSYFTTIHVKNYPQLLEIFQTISSENTLDEKRTLARQIIDQNYTDPTITFPIVRREQILDRQYGLIIQNLQQDLQSLQITYSI